MQQSIAGKHDGGRSVTQSRQLFGWGIVFFSLLLGLGVLSAGAESLTNEVELDQKPHWLLSKMQGKVGGVESDFWKWMVVPTFFYKPDTEFGGGFAGGVFHRFGHAERASSLKLVFSYTQLNQIALTVVPEIYSSDNLWLLSGKLILARYPFEYYGVGQNTTDDQGERYTPFLGSSDINVEYYLSPMIRTGLKMVYREEQMLIIEESGELIQGAVAGSDDYRISGFGPMITMDTRNHGYCPSEGYWITLQSLMSRRQWGSSYDYESVEFNGRYFVPLSPGHVLGLQTVVGATWGEPPVQLMNLLGTYLRGFSIARFRDKMMLVSQAEYRYPIWESVRGVAFFGIGKVSESFQEVSASSLELAGGLGLRIMMIDEGVNLRIDYGFAKDHGGYLYLNFMEAF